MGIESQVILVRVDKSIKLEQLLTQFKQLGFSVHDSSDNIIHLERNTKNGIHEVEILLENSQIVHCSLRFSFGNPDAIVDETYHLLKRLCDNFPIRPYFLNPGLLLFESSEKKWKKICKIIAKKKNSFEHYFMRINKPIRGGKETFDYIRKHKQK